MHESTTRQTTSIITTSHEYSWSISEAIARLFGGMIALPQDCEPELVIKQSDDEGDKLVLRFTSVVSSPGAFERLPATEGTVKVPKIYPIGTELCPECDEPLPPIASNWRACEKCDWQGDWSKVKHASGSVPEGTHKCNY